MEEKIVTYATTVNGVPVFKHVRYIPSQSGQAPPPPPLANADNDWVTGSLILSRTRSNKKGIFIRFKQD